MAVQRDPSDSRCLFDLGDRGVRVLQQAVLRGVQDGSDIPPGVREYGLTSVQPASGQDSSPTRWLALALLVTAQLMLVLDVTVVNVALPDCGVRAAGGRIRFGACDSGRSSCRRGASSWGRCRGFERGCTWNWCNSRHGVHHRRLRCGDRRCSCWLPRTKGLQIAVLGGVARRTSVDCGSVARSSKGSLERSSLAAQTAQLLRS